MAFKLTVWGSVRMRKAILESVTTEVGLLPTDGVLGSFGGLVPGSRVRIRSLPQEDFRPEFPNFRVHPTGTDSTPRRQI